MSIRIKNEFLLIYVLVILCIIFITLFPSNVLRIILGLPLMLFFPGYALVAATSPRKSSLDTLERIALSLGLSVIVTAVLGFILNLTPLGIRLYPVLVSLAVFIVIASAFAWYRRHRLAEQGFAISFTLKMPQWGEKTLLNRIMLVILIVVIIGTMGSAGYAIANFQKEETFTEFYILGSENKVGNYPTELKAGEKGQVTVAIINHENKTETYRVEVRIDGVINNEAGPITLLPEDRWENEVGFTPVQTGDNRKVEFLLYWNNGSEQYMNPLHLWVDVKE